ncbi:MAG: hypothetical protein H3C62_10730 [Gemmatimonadaceae bacterium]|nr:hypothetical protein [Gemmatimonadaceae bacterium]
MADQLRAHRIEVPARYEAEIRESWVELQGLDRTAPVDEPVRSFRTPVSDRFRIRQMRFGNFHRCLFPEQQFHSDGERRFAVLLEDEEDESVKWFRPGKRDLRLFWSADHQYVPDFVVETSSLRLLVEIKDVDDVADAEVQAKANAAVAWCGHATKHAEAHAGKPWVYLLVPDVAVQSNVDLNGLVQQYQCSGGERLTT